MIDRIVHTARGFLGTGAPFDADVNLVVQLAMGAALAAGVVLAKRKHFRAHGICQTTVMLLNLVTIGLVMLPAFRQQVVPKFSRILRNPYYSVPTIHAALGIAAEILGLYIILVAGTNLLPAWLRFKQWKRWMQLEFVLWLIVLITGVATYYAWYIRPFS